MIEENRNPGHKFVSFFVCRNPVDKLLSIYNFNVFRRFVFLLHNYHNYHNHNYHHHYHNSSTVKGASHLEGFPAGGPPPSWDEWIHSLAAGQVGAYAIA